MSPAIEVHELVKRYGERTALAGISFEVASGELFALLGPNGAGKTTTVEILEGYRRADAGSARVLGLDPGDRRDRDGLRRQVGLMLQEPSLYPQLNAREIVGLVAAYHRDRSAGTPAPEAWLERVGLNDAALLRTAFRRLSRGERQRVSLAAALVGLPALLFLDEPTAGLDVSARGRTEDLLRQLRDAGTTILLTTHDLAQVERVADRVAIIDHGRIVAAGKPSELMGDGRGLRFSAPTGLPAVELGAELGVDVSELDPGQYAIDGTVTPALVASLAAALARRDVLMRELRVGAVSLESLFLRLTSEDDS